MGAPAEELPVPYQILPEDVSTQFSLEGLSLFGEKGMVLTQILMVNRGASDITLRLEGRYGVKETVEYLTMGPVNVSM